MKDEKPKPYYVTDSPACVGPREWNGHGEVFIEHRLRGARETFVRGYFDRRLAQLVADQLNDAYNHGLQDGRRAALESVMREVEKQW